MTMYLKLYGIAVAIFFAIDMVWLGVVAKPFYQSRLKDLLRPDVNWGAAIGFYLIYVVGILLFAVLPGLKENSVARAAGFGALFGFFTYATYDLTNLATLRGWPVAVVVVDIAWGIVLGASVAALTCWAGRGIS